MLIQEAAEMYLETILMIEKRSGRVRSVDVANAMKYSRPTVSEQMKKFRENGLIDMDEAGLITLTSAGRDIAERMYERHNVIARIFIGLGVDEQTAYEDACRVEHYISQKTFDAMRAHFSELDKEIK